MYEEHTGKAVPTLYASLTNRSPKLTKELEQLAANQPMPLDWVLEMAQIADLKASEVYLPEWHPQIPRVDLADGNVRETFTADGTTVVWKPYFQSGKTEVHLAPLLHVQGNTGPRQLGGALLAAGGIVPKTVSLSEPVLFLTAPDWVVKQLRDAGHTTNAELLCLESEVLGYAWGYIELIRGF